MKKCTITFCQKETSSRKSGYCVNHFTQIRRYGSIKNQRCAADSCSRNAVTTDYCKWHERQASLYGDTGVLCAVDGCEKKYSTRNLCWNHYHKEYRRGTFSKSKLECLTPHCAKPAKNDNGRSRFCNACYTTMLTHKLDTKSFLALGSFCEVCGGANRLCVDHDHETNLVRGLLCTACNSALGLLKEDVKIMESLIDYKKKHTP